MAIQLTKVTQFMPQLGLKLEHELGHALIQLKMEGAPEFVPELVHKMPIA